MPFRYKLIAERPSRPGGEALDNIIMDAIMPEGGEEGEERQEPGFARQVGSLSPLFLRQFISGNCVPRVSCPCRGTVARCAFGLMGHFFLPQVVSTIASMQRFMRSLSN